VGLHRTQRENSKNLLGEKARKSFVFLCKTKDKYLIADCEEMFHAEEDSALIRSRVNAGAEK
jgi:hypothetical protein